MADYKKMYTILIDGIEKAKSLLQSLEPFDALNVLINAQLSAEDIYIETDDNDESDSPPSEGCQRS